MKRIDDTTAPNILYVVTYPIELVPAPQGYNMSGDDYALDAQNYANGSGTIANKFRPITQSELSTVCLSAVYKNNRVQSSYRMINDTSAIKETTNKDIELYPNPIKDILT